MKPVVFFDMDGTLLNMGESAFEKEYLQRMLLFFERKFPGKGKDVMKAMGYAAEKMKQNDGSQSNEILFWQAFEKASGQTRENFEPQFLHDSMWTFHSPGRVQKNQPHTLFPMFTLSDAVYSYDAA